MREKTGKKATTIALAPEMIEEIKVEAARTGVPWTSMVSVLIRQALDTRKAVAS